VRFDRCRVERPLGALSDVFDVDDEAGDPGCFVFIATREESKDGRRGEDRETTGEIVVVERPNLRLMAYTAVQKLRKLR
jgi:hypothetical protein